MTDTGFIRGNSDNIPEVDEEMLTLFFIGIKNFNSATRAHKIDGPFRDGYTDSSIGHVMVKKENTLCITKCHIVPELTPMKTYIATVVIDEAEERVVSCQCSDCSGSHDGCAHSAALLFWLYRRNKEAGGLPFKCYYEPPLNAALDPTIPFITAAELGGNQRPLPEGDGSFLRAVVESLKGTNSNAAIMRYFRDNDD